MPELNAARQYQGSQGDVKESIDRLSYNELGFATVAVVSHPSDESQKEGQVHRESRSPTLVAEGNE